jgi:hypothetical protein
MEAQTTAPATTPAPATAPAPEVANVTYQAPAPTPQMETGGAMETIAKPKMNIKDIVISALLIVVSIYGIFYYRKAIKKLDEQPSSEEFDTMSGDIEEVKYNLQKALGRKYQKT